MTLLELKKYIIKMPKKFDSFEVVNGKITPTVDGKTLIMVNDFVHTVYVDEKAQEVQFLHQTDEDVKELVKTIL